MAGTKRRTLDPDALAVAVVKVQEFLDDLAGSPTTHAGEQAEKLAEVAIDAYMGDIVRQLDLRPCEDCEDEDDDASNIQTAGT